MAEPLIAYLRARKSGYSNYYKMKTNKQGLCLFGPKPYSPFIQSSLCVCVCVCVCVQAFVEHVLAENTNRKEVVRWRVAA